MTFIIFCFLCLSVSSATIPAYINGRILQDSLQQKQQIQKKSIPQNLSLRDVKRMNKKINSPDLNRTANRHAVWGFIFGLASLVIFPLLGIPGLILSNDALNMEKVKPGTLTPRNRKLALAGKILSYIGLAILIIAILYVAFIVAILSAFNW